ncbi:Pet127-domain-containing protein [Mollisia scopiformis]|uniref:Pet127-domain-containing protein n=1 Tax=Mollisia scopiformis TaxID=149040 RepID=A0A194XJM8_MOLSC|nr:Pet127-domain-containing protein [Mollisia scopiformis]KUJ19982.1 Pet127-domain-containing protein [Mollisia scopiformis]
MTAHEIETVKADNLELIPIDSGPLNVPKLAYGLERVLFNPGVYQLQDPRTRVFNFDPYLQTIMPVDEFDFNALKQYVTSSKDDTLLSKAAAEKKKYTGSTSSMTASLAHFHFLLSQWRLINVGNLSKMFPVQYHTFTAFQRCPTSIFLRWKDGTYAIDADKQFDGASVLSMLGKSMEKLLTLPMEDFEKYRKGKSDQISEEERNEPEAFHYTTMGDFLMRSQLDAYDSRLPGTGMFDLKTRAVISVRMDTDAYEEGRGYQIRNRHGEWESFEREYYDMIRSAFLKYSLQVRMGRMDGIFVAFHNTERIFGFQYISLEEMDYALHGSDDRRLGDAEFKLSVDLLNRVLDRATTKFPEKSLRIHFETRDAVTPFMYIFAEPVEEDRIEEIQATNRDKAEEFERRVLGLEAEERNEQEKIAQWNALRARVERTMKQDEEAPEQQLEGAEDDADAMTEEERHQIQEPLLAMTLTIRNLVDGEYVAQPDAENYPPGAKWDVEYALAEVQDRDRADLLYKACKLRRKRTYTNTVDLTANVLQDAFLERIKTLSREGRVWRDKQKEIEEKLPLRTLDETLQKSSEIRNEESNDDNDAHDEEGEGEVKS